MICYKLLQYILTCVLYVLFDLHIILQISYVKAYSFQYSYKIWVDYFLSNTDFQRKIDLFAFDKKFCCYI